MRINSNIGSLMAQRYMSQTTRALGRALERLSTGKRINSAKDDASGLAVSNRLEAGVRAMRQSVRNINEAFGYLSTAEGAMQTQTEIVQRMRELAMQAANGTYSDDERAYLQVEFEQLIEEFSRITNDANFNGVKLLDGSETTRRIQVGGNRGDQIDVSLVSTRMNEIFDYEASAEELGDSIIFEGDGTFAYGTTVSTGVDTHDATFVHLNNDDILDMLVTNYGAGTVSVRLGVGDGTFTTAATIAADTTPATAPVVGDFNNDGYQDFAVANYNGATVSIRLGNGDGTFTSMGNIAVGNGPDAAPVFRDFNGDNILDFIIANGNGGTVSVRIGVGDGTFTAAATITTTAGPGQVMVADFNGDNILDFITSGNVNQATVMLGIGNGTFTNGATISIDLTPRSPIISDLNGDNIKDLVFVNTHASSQSVSIRIGVGDGTFTGSQTISFGTTMGTAQLVDMNNDNMLDLIVSTGAGIAVRLGNGNGTFTTATTTAAGTNISSFVIRDIDGDDINDLVIANSDDDNVSIRYGVGDGTFTVGATLTVGDAPASIRFADINGDDVDDMVVTNRGSSQNVSVFLSNTITGTGPGQDASFTEEDLLISTRAYARNALIILDHTIEEILSRRASIGAQQSRLEVAASVNMMTYENLAQAKSQVLDADIAEETAELTRAQILQQAGAAVLGQANSNLQIVLSLLRNI